MKRALGLPVIEFTFNYAEIGFLRIEQWLETAWEQYAIACWWERRDMLARTDSRARYHDYE